jgi:hypothetical protein
MSLQGCPLGGQTAPATRKLEKRRIEIMRLIETIAKKLRVMAFIPLFIAAMALAPSGHAQYYESEEWYDPGDWFDYDNYDYEYDDYYDSDYGYYDTDYGYYDTDYGYDDYDYGEDFWDYDYDYGYNYYDDDWYEDDGWF